MRHRPPVPIRRKEGGGAIGSPGTATNVPNDGAKFLGTGWDGSRSLRNWAMVKGRGSAFGSAYGPPRERCCLSNAWKRSSMCTVSFSESVSVSAWVNFSRSEGSTRPIHDSQGPASVTPPASTASPKTRAGFSGAWTASSSWKPRARQTSSIRERSPPSHLGRKTKSRAKPPLGVAFRAGEAPSPPFGHPACRAAPQPVGEPAPHPRPGTA